MTAQGEGTFGAGRVKAVAGETAKKCRRTPGE